MVEINFPFVCLDFVRDFFYKYYFFGVLNYFGLIMLS